jgi:hypothetical protein
MVSPYLLRRIRTLKEVARARRKLNPLEAVVKQALAEARAAGKGPHDQVNRAAMAVLELYPEMSRLDALAAVQRVRKAQSARPR